ncbi:MAG: hypothetical protein ACR2NP_02360 [Pirellulaceae bacterium]
MLSEKPEFRGIYKCSLATYTVLSKISSREIVLVKAAAGLARRLPVMVATQQLSLAYVQLRQFVELAVWVPYFKEHAVEWTQFLNSPSVGLSSDQDFPFKYAAHRELSWYFAYAKERFENDLTGIVGEELSNLRTQLPVLSPNAHAAYGAIQGTFHDAFDKVTTADLRKLQSVQRIVFSGGVLLILAIMPRKLSKLDAAERAWLDWLIRSKRAKQLRGDDFGIR